MFCNVFLILVYCLNYNALSLSPSVSLIYSATTFLEFWKRKEAELRYDWDVADYELEEHMRPEFEAKCTKWKKNPVTQVRNHDLVIKYKTVS